MAQVFLKTTKKLQSGIDALLNKGSPQAQSELGYIFSKGYGVPQDNTMAHMWFNIGSANGYEISGSNRDILSKKMTPAAIEKAQAMARECINSGYTKCGY